MQLDIAVLSERGGRTENQDACGYWSGADASYFVLCDGAGGHLGGGVAAKLAVGEALQRLRATRVCSAGAVEAAMRGANEALVREQQAQAAYSQMRATIVALAIDLPARKATWGHLGDSRLYCFRDGRIVAQTRDHSVVQSLVDAGYLDPQKLRSSPDRSKLLSALGDAEHFDPAVEQQPFALMPGDRFLLCTDGLWEYVQESEMQQALGESAAAQDWLRALERFVLERGTRKHDNYSALAIWCSDGESST
ncbi:MAG TPA: PP2C family serine/threonine-protein phosphatase [Burkholderiales bacterium]|nr:PP2C family serine/threonine-protein phosphatase [Burkholderiales bacterium]